MTTVGDELWAWQSQLDDGSWSIIAIFAATLSEAQESTVEQLRANNPELQVLVHRDCEAALNMMAWALLHSQKFGQPIRFAHFTLTNAEARLEEVWEDAGIREEDVDQGRERR